MTAGRSGPPCPPAGVRGERLVGLLSAMTRAITQTMTTVAGQLPAVIHSVVTHSRGDNHEACVRASTRLLSLTNFKVSL